MRLWCTFVTACIFSTFSGYTLKGVQVFPKTCTQLAERARPDTHFHYHVVYRIVQLSVIEENMINVSQWQHLNIYVYACAALGSQVALLLVHLARTAGDAANNCIVRIVHYQGT